MGEEFYAIIKLTSGEEILSVVCVDESEDEAVIILNNPVTMKYISHPGMRSLVKVKPWLELSDQDIFVIRQDKIITMTETQDAKLISVYDQFVSDMDDDYIIIGSPYDAPGSAYIFVRDGTSWTQQAKLTGSDAWNRDRFGIDVAIYLNYAVVGAYSDDDNGSASGSAYIFVRDNTSLSLIHI